jgi:hypothetical protein
VLPKLLPTFLDRNIVILTLKEAVLRAQHATLKDVLNNEHKIYCLAFAENSINCQWDTVIFSNESTFSSANGGPV